MRARRFLFLKGEAMRIDANVSQLHASQRAQTAVADRSDATASFSAALAASQANRTQQTDFTQMSRQEMRDWVNSEIRSGAMSLDDSRPFMAMTMKIPVSGGQGGELSAGNDDTRYDFMQKVRDGIQGALSRNDATTLQMLESALQIMQKYQGQTVSLDARS